MDGNINCEHSEQSFSDKVSTLYLKLSRTDDVTNHKDIAVHYKKLWLDCVNIDTKLTVNSEEYANIESLYALLFQTRDIVDGKGERQLSYVLIGSLLSLASVWPKALELAQLAIRLFVLGPFEEDFYQRPYGSWKDIKYLWKYLWNPVVSIDDEICDNMFTYMADLVIEQIHIDGQSNNPSLCAKWIPREKSRNFGAIFRFIAERYNRRWLSFDTIPNQNLTSTELCEQNIVRGSAKRKCYTYFRKVLSRLNARLNTVQITQCNGNWDDIDFRKQITSATFLKQCGAFLNSKRPNCRSKFMATIENKDDFLKGSMLTVGDLVKAAFNPPVPHVNSDSMQSYRVFIDKLWENNCIGSLPLGRAIPVIDLSESMENGNSGMIETAIGLGIRISEKSTFKNRVLGYSHVPHWINLDECSGFCEKATFIKNNAGGTSSNICNVIDLLLKTSLANKVRPSELENTTLVILSDMQFTKHHKTSLATMIKDKFARFGIEHGEIPWIAPRIVLWSLSEGMPNGININEPRVSVITGWNPKNLGHIAGCGSGAERIFTPALSVQSFLSLPRYDITRHELLCCI